MTLEFAITARSNIDNPEYLAKYKDLKVVPSVARFGHSIWGGGEVWGGEETSKLSNKLLSLGANQKTIKEVGMQTNHNQRDDADIMTAAYINKCSILVSDDKKFMLKNEVIDLMKKYGVTVMSSQAFISDTLSNE
jgi:hypothetical protein